MGIGASPFGVGAVTAAGCLSATVLVQLMAFSFIWFAILPLQFLALNEVGWWSGLDRVLEPEMMTVWRPVDDEFMSWPATLIGLGFALAFASWATDQALLQNILAARSRRDAPMPPLVGGIDKLARNRVVEGRGVSVRVDRRGVWILKKNQNTNYHKS